MPNLHYNNNMELLKIVYLWSLKNYFRKILRVTLVPLIYYLRCMSIVCLKQKLNVLNETAPGSTKNGYATKTLKTTHGTIEVKVPRVVDEKFNSEILTTYSSYTNEQSDAIILLLSLDLSTKDISYFINKTYGVQYSKQSIIHMSTITDNIVKSFKTRKLYKRHISIFIDATYFPISLKIVTKNKLFIYWLQFQILCYYYRVCYLLLK